MRIGWIGCGRHAEEMLLPQLTRLPITLAAICDANAERLALIGNRYGVSARYTDAEALLAHVLVNKYSDHLPLYRQAQIFA